MVAANVSSSVHKESMVIRSQDMGEKLCRPFQSLHRGWGWKGKQFPTHSIQRERHMRICALFIQSQEYILSKWHCFSVSTPWKSASHSWQRSGLGTVTILSVSTFLWSWSASNYGESSKNFPLVIQIYSIWEKAGQGRETLGPKEIMWTKV